jgi:pre-mRNA-processing factor 39
LTKIKSVEEEAKKAAGPSVDQQELIKAKAEEDNKALLDAYWHFVKHNPQDFTGWTYLLQHVEKTDILDEIRSVYKPFLEL